MAFVYSQARANYKKYTFFIACRISAHETEIITFWIPSFKSPSGRESLFYILSFNIVTCEKRVGLEQADGKTTIPSLFTYHHLFQVWASALSCWKRKDIGFHFFEQVFKNIMS
jgi:hypothetical protein